VIKLIILAIILVAAFNAGSAPQAGVPLTPPATVEPAHENPGYQPGWGCDHPDDTTGVKGRILAVPVDPADEC
jgi:hypothetical protein